MSRPTTVSNVFKGPVALKDVLDESGEKHVADIKFLDLSSFGFTQMGVVPVCRSLTVLVLRQNHLRELEGLNELSNLQYLDVSQNRLSELPNSTDCSHLKKLSVLFAHDNHFSVLNGIRGISGFRALRLLTLHRNRIALEGHYRHYVTSLNEKIMCLDGQFVTEDETSKESAQLSMGTLQLVGTSTGAKDFKEGPASSFDNLQEAEFAFRSLMSDLHKSYSAYRPLLVIQKMHRARLQRKIARAIRKRKHTAAAIIGRLWVNSAIEPKIHAICRMINSQNVDDNASFLARLVASSTSKADNTIHTWDAWGNIEARSIFFSPECPEAVLMICMAAKEMTQDTCDIACSSVWAVRHSQRWSSADNRKVSSDALLRKGRPSAPLSKIAALRTFPALQQVVPLVSIMRRGYRVNAMEIREFKKFMSEEIDARNSHFSPARRRLLVCTFGKAVSVQRVWAILRKLSALVDLPFTVLASSFVRRSVAATCMNSCVRSFLARCRQKGKVIDKLLQHRAAVALQRWWKWNVVLQSRFRLLSFLKGLVHRCKGTRTLLFTPEMEATIRSISRPMTTAIVETCISPLAQPKNGWLFCMSPSIVDTNCSRRVLPMWLSGSSLPRKGITYHEGQPSASLADSVFNVMSKSSVSRLPVPGSKGRSPMGRRPLFAAVFPNDDVAVSAAISVACHTWKLKNTLPQVSLEPPAGSARIEGCVVIQSAFRGHLIRRVVSSRVRMIRSCLGNSVLGHQRKVWTSQAQRDGRAEPYNKIYLQPGLANAEDWVDEDMLDNNVSEPSPREMLREQNRTISLRMKGEIQMAMQMSLAQNLLETEAKKGICASRRAEAAAAKKRKQAAEAIQLAPVRTLQKLVSGDSGASKKMREQQMLKENAQAQRKAHKQRMEARQRLLEMQKDASASAIAQHRSTVQEVIEDRFHRVRQLQTSHKQRRESQTHAHEQAHLHRVFSDMLGGNLTLLNKHISQAEILQSRKRNEDSIKIKAEQSRNDKFEVQLKREQKMLQMSIQNRDRAEQVRRHVQTAIGQRRAAEQEEILKRKRAVQSSRASRGNALRPGSSPMSVIRKVYDMPMDASKFPANSRYGNAGMLQGAKLPSGLPLAHSILPHMSPGTVSQWGGSPGRESHDIPLAQHALNDSGVIENGLSSNQGAFVNGMNARPCTPAENQF